MLARFNPSRGFTLVELIIVIVLLAITGLFVFSYLGFGAQIFRDTTERDQLVSQSRFALNRLSSELRNAVPRSIRVSAADSQRCLEFMPILASSQYVRIPRPGPPSVSNVPFTAIEPSTLDNLVGGYLLVYATTSQHIYGNATQRRKEVTGISPPVDNLIEISYSPSTFFITDSPVRRYYIGSAPISWCYDETTNGLYRFEGYGRLNNQPSFSQLQVSTATSAELMAENIYNDLNNSEFPYKVFEATLYRNSLVQLDWRFRRDNAQEPLEILHEVSIPNVP
ncbi:PilW family protein [Pseudidiomarina gelatinasegens]|uniref:PilW family protein n=1 Tax=Pseudidiomarina gelatinasegens TaxID=2487740 RepID=UPI003A96D99D